jgi:hypothetical protein
MTTLLMSQPPSLAIRPLRLPFLLLSSLPKAIPPTRQSRPPPLPLTPTSVFPSPCHPPISPKPPSPLSTWSRMTAGSTLMICRRRSLLLTFQSRVSFCARLSLAASCALCGAYIAVDRSTHLTFCIPSRHEIEVRRCTSSCWDYSCSPGAYRALIAFLVATGDSIFGHPFHFKPISL